MPVTPPSTGSAHSSSSVNTPCNPLLAAGLIPESLADILHVPERKEKETRRRINTKARVITGDEYVEELKKMEEEAQQKEQESQRKKKGREEKKAAKEMEKRKKEEEKSEKRKKEAEKRKKEAEKSKMVKDESRVNPRKNTTPDQGSSSSKSISTAENNPQPSGTCLRPSCSRNPPVKVIEALLESSSSSESEEDDSCFKCGKKDPPIYDGSDIDWICCRSCD